MSRVGTQIKVIIYILNYFSMFPNLYNALAIQLIIYLLKGNVLYFFVIHRRQNGAGYLRESSNYH